MSTISWIALIITALLVAASIFFLIRDMKDENERDCIFLCSTCSGRFFCDGKKDRKEKKNEKDKK